VKEILPDNAILADAFVLDVREPEEYAQGHVPGAVNVPQADLASTFDQLPCHQPIVVICKAGYRSLRAAQFLHQSGLTNVMSVKGGTDAWCAAGNPVTTEESAASPSRIKETEWAHGGLYDYSI
jgi:rhodanese-related sulfurtransferase